jgi:poly(3-hydroxybutyrate) depolymerase
VPLASGPFGLADYTWTVMRFLESMGPGSHLMAVCQPCVATLAATSLMSEDGQPATPSSLTVIAGPDADARAEGEGTLAGAFG